MLGKVACWIDKHDWSEWDYEATDRCEQIRVCSRSKGHIEKQTVHDWGEWEYETQELCTLVMRCNRCNEHRQGYSRIKHDWGQWEYEATDSCSQVRICARSAEHKELQAVHDWGEWEYETPNSCSQQRVCKRNKEHKESRISHLGWDGTLSCIRCGESSGEYNTSEYDEEHELYMLMMGKGSGGTNRTGR